MDSYLKFTKFNKNEVDEEYVRARATKEAIRIHSKESTRKGRELQTIINECIYGHRAEVHMMNHGYPDNDKPYKDLFEKDGKTELDVKVTKCEAYIPYLLETLRKYKTDEKWRNFPDRVYIWINDKISDIYDFNGLYIWNGTNFIKN